MKKRGFLGSTEIDTTQYWSAGKGSEELRCNETILYAEIDVEQENVAIARTKDGVQECYNRMDMLFMCLQAIDKYATDKDKLHKAGVVIGNMVADGLFSQTYSSLEAENQAVDNRIVEMHSRVENFVENSINGNFMEWYVENVEQYNYYNNFDGTKTVDTPHLSGLRGTETYDTNAAEVKKSGGYFLYVLTDENGNDAGKKKTQVLAKKAKHIQYMNDIANKTNSNMTFNSIKANAMAGATSSFGEQPKNVMKLFKEGSKKVNGLGFGLSIGAILTIVSLCLSALGSILTAVLKYMTEKEQISIQKEAILAQQEQAELLANQGYDLYGMAPSEEDWIDFNGDGVAQDDEIKATSILKSPVLWLGGAAVIVGIILFN